MVDGSTQLARMEEEECDRENGDSCLMGFVIAIISTSFFHARTEFVCVCETNRERGAIHKFDLKVCSVLLRIVRLVGDASVLFNRITRNYTARTQRTWQDYRQQRTPIH